MRLRLLGAFLAITLFVLVALEVPLAVNFRDRQLAELKNGLERDAFVLSSYVQSKLEDPDAGELSTIAINYSQETDGRVVIIAANGDVLADTDPLRDGIRNFATRPEVAAALDQKVASGSRYSQSLKTGLVYVAVPVSQGNKVVGAVRLSYSTAQVDSRVHSTGCFWDWLQFSHCSSPPSSASCWPDGSRGLSGTCAMSPVRSVTVISRPGPMPDKALRRYAPLPDRSTPPPVVLRNY